jgi:hypothetical protein
MKYFGLSACSVHLSRFRLRQGFGGHVRGESLPSGLTRGSTREARRVGVPATDTVPVERAPTPTLPREERERERGIASVDMIRTSETLY